MQQNELHHPPPQFKAVLGTGIVPRQRPSCFVVRSIDMVEKLHQLQHSSTYSSEKWFGKRFFKLVNSAVFGKSFIWLFVLLFSYILTHSLQLKFFFFMIICFYVFIYPLIAGKAFIFMIICSCLCFDSFIVPKFLPLYLFVLMYWFIYCR